MRLPGIFSSRQPPTRPAELELEAPPTSPPPALSPVSEGRRRRRKALLREFDSDASDSASEEHDTVPPPERAGSQPSVHGILSEDSNDSDVCQEVREEQRRAAARDGGLWDELRSELRRRVAEKRAGCARRTAVKALCAVLRSDGSVRAAARMAELDPRQEHWRSLPGASVDVGAGVAAGAAVTVAVQPSRAVHRDTLRNAPDDFRRHVAGTQGPKILVVSDADAPSKVCGSLFADACFGESMLRLGVEGCVTDGAVSRTQSLRSIGLRVAAAEQRPCAAWAWPMRWGGSEQVHGVNFTHGDIVVMDSDGAVCMSQPLTDGLCLSLGLKPVTAEPRSPSPSREPEEAPRQHRVRRTQRSPPPARRVRCSEVFADEIEAAAEADRQEAEDREERAKARARVLGSLLPAAEADPAVAEDAGLAAMLQEGVTYNDGVWTVSGPFNAGSCIGVAARGTTQAVVIHDCSQCTVRVTGTPVAVVATACSDMRLTLTSSATGAELIRCTDVVCTIDGSMPALGVHICDRVSVLFAAACAAVITTGQSTGVCVAADDDFDKQHTVELPDVACYRLQGGSGRRWARQA